MQYYPLAPAGVYSASLGARQPHHPIVTASIQSVYKKAHILGHRDLVFADECHLVSSKNMGMYRTLIADLHEINPAMKIIGLSATIYRTQGGMLHHDPESIFTDVAIDIPVLELVEQGYLSRLVSKVSTIQADLSHVQIIKGDYNIGQQSEEFRKINKTAVEDVIKLSHGRKAIIVFCTTIEHAEEVAKLFTLMGRECKAVSSKTSKEDRARILQDFKKNGGIIASVNVLSTGFDAPNVDCVVLFRATKSPGLYVQIVGRGMRIHPGKENCLVLDYGGNIQRHGPITDVRPPPSRNSKKEKPFQPTIKICHVCRTAWPLGTTECAECGAELTQERDPTSNMEEQAADVDIMGEEPTWETVDSVDYYCHKKPGSPDSVKVTYMCGYRNYLEWICLNHEGYALRKAQAWLRKAIGDNYFDETQGWSTNKVLLNTHLLQQPSKIKVKKSGKYWEIIDHDYTARKTEIIADNTKPTDLDSML